MKEIEFEITDDDWLHFQWVFTRSKQMRKGNLKTYILLLLLVLVIQFVLSGNLQTLLGVGIFFLFYMFIFGFLLRGKSWQSMTMRHLASARKNKLLMGRQVCRLSDDGIFHGTEGGESTIYWETVTEVQSDDQLLMLFVGTMQAVLIPQRAFIDREQHNEFVAYINENVATHLPIAEAKPQSSFRQLSQETSKVLSFFIAGIVFFGLGWGMAKGGSGISSGSQHAEPRTEMDEALVITGDKLSEYHKRPTILGQLDNLSLDSWRDISLEANFFDQEGELVEQCALWLSETLEPADSVNFKIDCDGAQYKGDFGELSYKVRVIDAYGTGESASY